MKFVIKNMLLVLLWLPSVSCANESLFLPVVFLADQLKDCMDLIGDIVDDQEQSPSLKYVCFCLNNNESDVIAKNILIRGIEDALLLLEKHEGVWAELLNI